MILSIDFGTSSLKLGILDEAFSTVHWEKETYPYILLPGEKVEIDPDAMMAALVKAASRMPKRLMAQVDLLCYDSFSPSLMLMDEAGNALYPVVTHMDRRSREQSGAIRNIMGKERYQAIAGVYPFTGGVSLTTLLWFMAHAPDLCRSVRRIGHLPTYLHRRFTGRWAVDLVNASMMGLYDTVGQSGWSEEILETFSIPAHWLPSIHTPGERLGMLLPEMAALLGLHPGLPVAMGTNDAMASQAGAGNDRSGQALNIAGSSDMISILVNRPALHPGYYVRNAARKGLWQIYATTSGGFAVDWFYRQFCREMDEAAFYGDYLPACAERAGEASMKGTENTRAQEAAGDHVAFDPYLSEDRQSLEQKKAAWHGLSLGTTREDMLSSLLLSMQRVLRDTLTQAASQIPMKGILKVTGGFAESIMPLKRAVFTGYALDYREDCTLRGNGVLAAEA